MQTEHVAGQLARCFGCREPIQHKATEFLDPVRLNCLTCHPDHHIYQKMLLVGDKRKGVPKMPGLMELIPPVWAATEMKKYSVMLLDAAMNNFEDAMSW